MGNSYSQTCTKKNYRTNASINEKIPPQYNSLDSPINTKIKLYEFKSHRSLYTGKVRMEDLKTFITIREEKNEEFLKGTARHASTPTLKNSIHFKTLKEDEEDKHSILFEEKINLKDFIQMKNKKLGTVREDLKNQYVNLEMHYTLVDTIYKDIPGIVKKALSLKDNKIYEIQIIPKNKIERSVEFVSEIHDFMLIKHENIIQVIDFLYDQDNYYLIKELSYLDSKIVMIFLTL